MRSFLVLFCVLMLALPAGATEPSGGDGMTPLTQLIAEGESEIAFYEAAASLGTIDAPLSGPADPARLHERFLRADAFIGMLRSEANDFLHAHVPTDAANLLFSLDPALDAAGIGAALEVSSLPSDSVWAAAAVAADWAAFQSMVLRLRAVVEPGSPERVCPVGGWTWFQNEWEVPRPRGRIHKGVDMHAELGAPLYAVEDGVVVQANWHYLGGRQVYLRADSTGDVYYYAHLEYWPKWLWTGTRLSAGDYLGLAGRSGNATTPHLHLGWMPGSRSVDLDNLQNAYYLMFELCE